MRIKNKCIQHSITDDAHFAPLRGKYDDHSFEGIIMTVKTI
jgi:hypothetical protein